jgi:hypothetical protein
LDLLKQDPRVRSLTVRQLRDAVGELLEPLAYDFWHFASSRSLNHNPDVPIGELAGFAAYALFVPAGVAGFHGYG